MKTCVCRMVFALSVFAPVVALAQQSQGYTQRTPEFAHREPDFAQQPPGVNEALRNMTSERVNRTAFTFDHDMLQSAMGFLNDDSGPPMRLNSITVENYRYHEPAFYLPESLHALVAAYDSAGWKHLVDQHASPRDATTPRRNLTDLWLHYSGMDIDGVTVVVRGPRQMSVIEVSGDLRPLDLVHLSGHFGIPKVDPGAVMVPAPPGR